MTAAAPTGPSAGGIFEAVATLPQLIGNIIAGPIDPASGFFGAAALPAGTDISRVFGLRSPRALSGPTGIPIANPFETRLGSGVSVLGPRDVIGRGGFFGSRERGGSQQLAQFTQEALSFTPRIAERGEARIQSFLNAPITTGPGPLLSRSFPFQSIFRALGGPAAQVSTEQARRTQALASARAQTAKQAFSNPFFQAVAEATRQGVLPGAVASPAALAAFGTTPDPAAFAPLPQFLSSPTPVEDSVRTSILARLAALESPAAAAATTPAIRPTQEVSMATVPTTGLGGFFGGLTDIITASTPLLQTILPAILPQQRQPIFQIGGGGPALAGRLPGDFADPRFIAQSAGLFGDLERRFPGMLGQQQLQLPSGQNGCPPRGLPSRVDVPLPSGRFVTYKNMGQPVLFRGDLAACKRVRSVGRMVRKSVGGR